MTDSEAIAGWLPLMGRSPFFRNFETVPCVEDWLGADPELLAGLNDVVARALRAACENGTRRSLTLSIPHHRYAVRRGLRAVSPERPVGR